jgi:hypothetical protein
MICCSLDVDMETSGSRDVCHYACWEPELLKSIALLNMKFKPRVPISRVDLTLAVKADVVECVPKRLIAVGQCQSFFRVKQPSGDRRTKHAIGKPCSLLASETYHLHGASKPYFCFLYRSN